MVKELNVSLKPDRITISAWIFLGICVLAIVDAFITVPLVKLFTAGLIVLYIALQFQAIPIKQRLAGLGLISAGVLASFLGGGLWVGMFETLFEGVSRSRIFLLLFFAVAWLQLSVGESPALKSVREAIMNQPPGRRFLVLSAGVHVLGALLLSPILQNCSNPLLLRRLSVALMHGFTSASAWSPFYIGMIVVLVAIPSLEWQNIALQGMAMAVVLILGGWLFDRMRYPGKRTPASIAPQKIQIKVFRTVLLLGTLIGLVMLVTDIAQVKIPIALGLVCPPFGLIWYATLGGRRADKTDRVQFLAHQVVSSLPNLRSETLVFVAANVFGIGIASAIPTENMAGLLDTLLPWIDARIVALTLLFLCCGMIGLHPVIVVLSLAAILPPEVVGLRDWVLGLVYVGSWGLTTMISPISGATLFMSRYTGMPSHVIGWKWASYSVAFNAVLMVTFVIILRHATL